MRPPAYTITKLVRHIRLTYPDTNCSWPRILPPNLKDQWAEIEKAFNIALDDSIPWVQFLDNGKTILQQAYLDHVRGDSSAEFLTPGRLNEHARLIEKRIRETKQEAEMKAYRKEESLNYSSDPRKVSEQFLKFQAVQMTRGVWPFNPENPFAPTTQEKFMELRQFCQEMNKTRWKVCPVNFPDTMPSRAKMMGKRGGPPVRLGNVLESQERAKTVIASQER